MTRVVRRRRRTSTRFQLSRRQWMPNSLSTIAEYIFLHQGIVEVVLFTCVVDRNGAFLTAAMRHRVVRIFR